MQGAITASKALFDSEGYTWQRGMVQSDPVLGTRYAMDFEADADSTAPRQRRIFMVQQLSPEPRLDAQVLAAGADQAEGATLGVVIPLSGRGDALQGCIVSRAARCGTRARVC